MYYYRVMPFELKNVDATYQRMAIAMFHDIIHKEVEVYVDEMMVKSKTQEEHPATFEKFIQWVDKYNLRLNPKKISQRGIKVDPDKVKVIWEISTLKTKKKFEDSWESCSLLADL